MTPPRVGPLSLAVILAALPRVVAAQERSLPLLAYAAGPTSAALDGDRKPAAFTATEMSRWTRLARRVTIRRDLFGVPHIYGPTDASVVFGLMYAQAEDNFWQIEEDYLSTLGRRAEVYGDSTSFGDLMSLAFEVAPKARESFRRASPRMRAMYQAFADGINYYLATHPNTAPRLLTRFEPWFILATEHSHAGGNPDLVIDGVRLGDLLGVVKERSGERDEGSNMWALAPSRSASGHALLFINPHVGYFGGGQRYEMDLHSGEGWNFSGFAILGWPIPRTGHNAHLGWSHTNFYGDQRDVFVEKFDDPAHPLSYRRGGTHLTATQWTDSLRVKTDSGVIIRHYRLLKTHQGPVLSRHDSVGMVLTMARDGGGEGSLEQRYLMGKSRTLAEWRRAMERGTIVGSNTMYADDRGNIYYVHGNAVPRRSPGADPSKPLDGADPRMDWQGYHRQAELPHLLNPKSGFLINTNSSPFHMTSGGNPDSAAFPRYMAPEPFNARARQSLKLLSGGRRISFDELTRLGFDRHVWVADSAIAALEVEWREIGTRDSSRAAALRPLIASLEGWDHVSSTESVPMTLFNGLYFRSLRAPSDTTSAPRGSLVRALEETRRALEQDWGTWQVAWGEINRLQRVHTSGKEPFSDARPSLPTAGAAGQLGIIFAVYSRPERGQKRRYGDSGDSYVAVVEFGPTVRARSLQVFGESADPLSPHNLDQAELYASGRLKPAWFSRGEVLSHTERRYHPGERGGGDSTGRGASPRPR
ncbi:MAG: penicillin acylase family protein [Gemmatimonadota bacterium]|nr:penicillin acylase family protein [Gemmatimonadota bacterium]